jgi:hypothetical protein
MTIQSVSQILNYFNETKSGRVFHEIPKLVPFYCFQSEIFYFEGKFLNHHFRKYSLPHALRQILPLLILVNFSPPI